MINDHYYNLSNNQHMFRCMPERCDEKITLFNTWHQLWQQHVIWTRLLIISKVDKLGDVEVTATRLLRNPSDMGHALKTYFNHNYIDVFVSLFKEHLLIAASLVDAAVAGNSNLVAHLRNEWFKNADQIAHLLHILFPFESEQNWQKMMHEHLRLTENEAVLRIERKYKEDVVNYDAIETQALQMADMIANGIIKIFYK